MALAYIACVSFVSVSCVHTEFFLAIKIHNEALDKYWTIKNYNQLKKN